MSIFTEIAGIEPDYSHMAQTPATAKRKAARDLRWQRALPKRATFTDEELAEEADRIAEEIVAILSAK